MQRRAAILGLLLFGTLTVFGSGARALSCIPPEVLLEYHGAEVIALVGVVQDRDEDTATLSVSRWLAGAGLSTHVTLEDSDREDGPLLSGVEYVVIARPFDPPREAYNAGLCLPATPQASAEGQSLVRLIEQHFALPETEGATLATRADPTFALLGFGLAFGSIVAALRWRRQPST